MFLPWRFFTFFVFISKFYLLSWKHFQILKIFPATIFKELVAAFRNPTVTVTLALEPGCDIENCSVNPPWNLLYRCDALYSFTTNFLRESQSSAYSTMHKAILKGQCHEIFCSWFFSWFSFPQASEKIWNGLNGILWSWGETDSWKKPEAKNLVTLSL